MADFVNDFCDWIANRADPVLSRDTAPFSLFAHAAVEVEEPTRNYTDPYTVIRPFGGPPQRSDPLGEINLQIYTVGTQTDECMARATAIFAAMLDKRSPDDDGDTPVREKEISEDWYLIALDNLTPPGVLGRDAKERVEVVFNCGVLYRAA